MNPEDRNARNKGYINFRGSMHIGMGGLYLAVGSAVIYFKNFGVLELSGAVAYTIGAAMILYGVFRIWRGWTDLRRK
ncbi:MAG: hypothetical protein KDC07_03605 [Chitinophagaceae bacterium]|nr:hypothetical protein [Chitinophagaceae bacterium]MCB9044561.1 hypothetical protein [Chitinophagales bacterium]